MRTSSPIDAARRPVARAVAAFVLSVAACSAPASPDDTVAPPVVTDAAASLPEGQATPIDPGCSAPDGVASRPTSIADVVALVNALKAQHSDALTLPCFLQSLTRPMPALATRSVFSAQPATGPRNPRFFLFIDRLVVSVVPAGDGRPLLELADYVTETRSIKAEIHFPVEEPVTPAAPYERIRFGEGTSCGACHGDQQEIEDGGAVKRFVSDVLRPRTSELVDLDFVRDQSTICDPTDDPERCAMLSALFAHGPLTVGAFSPKARTIFGY